MSWLSQAAGAITKKGKSLVNGEFAGFTGQDKFKPNQYRIDANAFTDTSQLDPRKQSFEDQLAAVQGRKAPQMGSAHEQFRQGQMTLSQQLADQAAGRGPSLAQNQLQKATQANIANQMAMAATQGNANPAAALRGMQNNMGNLQAQAALDSSNLRMQEQMAAREQLAGVLSQGRGQDIDVGGANLQAKLQGRAMNDEQARFFNQGLMGMDMYNSDRRMDLEKLKVNQNLGIEDIRSGGHSDFAKRRGDFIGGVGAGIAGMGAQGGKVPPAVPGAAQGAVPPVPPVGSDEKLKTKTGTKVDASQDTDSFLKAWARGQADKKKNETGAMMYGKAVGAGLFAGGNKFVKEGGPEKIKGTLRSWGQGIGRAFDKVEHALHSSGKNESQEDEAPSGKTYGERNWGQMFSDERLKNVSSDDPDVEKFVDALQAHRYRYKDPKFGQHEYISPMAQEMERTPLGKGMVINTPEGKMVDYARAGGLMLASAAMLNDKVDNLEDQFLSAYKRRKKA